MEVLFFDVNARGVARFPLKIAREVEKLDAQIHMGAAHLLDDAPAAAVRWPFSTAKWHHGFGRLLEGLSPRLVVLFAHRVPDLLLMAAARNRGIQTLVVQHGLFVDHMPHLFGSLLSKKARKYGRLLPELYWEARHASVLRATPGRMPRAGLHADHALVFGEAWRTYFSEHYGYPIAQTEVVGYPDLDDPPQTAVESYDVCYIAQTLVEDGRLKKPRFLPFLDAFAQVAKGRRAIVKLHPRSDAEFYRERLMGTGIEVTMDSSLPISKTYLTHSSTLAAVAAHRGAAVVFWEFSEAPLPPYLRQTGDVVSTQVDLAKALQTTAPRTDIKDLERFFWKNPMGAWQAIARRVVERL